MCFGDVFVFLTLMGKFFSWGETKKVENKIGS